MADYLVARGMPFRQAHEVVGAMVRQLLSERRDFEAMSLDEWRQASDLFGDDVKAARHGGGIGRVRKTPQSTNPDAVRAALTETGSGLPGALPSDIFRLALRPGSSTLKRFPHSTNQAVLHLRPMDHGSKQ